MAKGKVFIIDDDVNIVRALKRRLEVEGYEVAATHDGATAVDVATQARPDIILLDILMPNVSGYDVCEAIKKDPALQGIPVIMLSGKDMGDDVEMALKRQADWYVVKPYDDAYLLAKIEQFLKERKQSGLQRP